MLFNLYFTGEVQLVNYFATPEKPVAVIFLVLEQGKLKLGLKSKI
jgi:hypothetical protein